MNVALRPENLNIISLCTGGGGLDLGVELAMPGARSVVLVEREAFAGGHLVAAMQQGLLGEAPIWSDVTTFNGRAWRGLVDGLIGGIPCQPHSLAGKRLGEEDERDLWSDARRIFVQSGAWFILIENVRGMLSSGGAERVWRDLQRLGCSVEVGLFTAAEVGASHERERVFILAVADSQDWRRDVGSAPRKRHGPQIATGGRRSDVVHAEGVGRGKGRPKSEFRSGRDASPSTDDAMGHAIGSGHHGRPDDALGRQIERAAVERPSRQAFGAMADASISRWQASSGDGLRVEQANRDGPAPCYRQSLFPPGPSDLSRWRHALERAPQLEPAFRRVADGLASRLDISRVDRLRMLGNGVVSLQAAYALRTLATRLAAGGSAGAARLVRGMELIA